MVNFPHTPEALLGRNDSKNPSTTCKGITSSGRPCRRAIAGGSKTSPLAAALNGVVKVVEEDGKVEEAEFYCWQHKDQATQSVQAENGAARKARRRRSAELYPLQERNSIDTLVERLGISGKEKEKKGRRKTEGVKPPNGTGALDFATRPTGASSGGEKYEQRPERRESRIPKKPGFWASLCCAASDHDDYVEVVRHRKRMEQQHQQQQGSRPPQAQSVGTPSSERPPRVPHESRPHSTSMPPRKPVSQGLAPRPSPHPRASSNPQTGHLLSLIPQHCSPQTTSALLAELIKPISTADEEGYIYIFWLTPQVKEAPGDSTARSLLAPPERRPQHERRISDVMTEFSFDGNDTTRGNPGRRGNGAKKTIMLKIGRANNVTRRMNEWQRQCGYKLNLVRWYPYVPSGSSPQASPGGQRRQSDVVRKVPCVKRVERLIHLELAEKRVLRDCETCGKEHREWFEVEASQEGVKGVDECVRRWVGWAERQGGG